MNNLKVTKSFTNQTAGPINQGRLVKITGPFECELATAADDVGVIGVADLGCSDQGDVLSVNLGGPNLYVELSDTMTAGTYFKSDDEGRAALAGAGKQAVGVLLESGVAGDLVQYLPHPVVMPAPAS